ncbi:hypothetical protein CARUB_v10024769mg, partial [Capsella rubella]
VKRLKRLTAKTLVRFLSVSKLWSSIIRRQDFKKLFLTVSSKQPQREAFIAAYHKTRFPYPYTVRVSHVRDLICIGTGSTSDKLVVYNTSTRRSITLPKLDSQSFYVVKQFLSYDPIDDVYKVLCMTRSNNTAEGKVLTLGNENSWKMIEGAWHTYMPNCYEICINGVLYYGLYGDNKETMHDPFVVSFDVRSEKFDLISCPEEVHDYLRSLGIMIRYEGKLAIMSINVSLENCIVLWVLENAMKHEWFEKVIDFPDSWPLRKDYRYIDFNDEGEFVLAPRHWCEPPYYVYYYDPKSNILRKVPITGYEGRPDFMTYLFTSTSQVESLMFL